MLALEVTATFPDPYLESLVSNVASGIGFVLGQKEFRKKEFRKKEFRKKKGALRLPKSSTDWRRPWKAWYWLLKERMHSSH